jgi:hypothetical protein
MNRSNSDGALGLQIRTEHRGDDHRDRKNIRQWNLKKP